jgi:hypothetical protein
MDKKMIDMLKEFLTTSRDLADARHGQDRVADAEAAVRETLALLKARRETIRIEKNRSQR